jgi:hypothetical protein
MKCPSMVTRLVVATIATAALAGPVTSAHALQFTTGDAVLAVYGNGTEYVQNLGTMTNLVTNGLTLNLSNIMSQISAGGNPLSYAIIGYNSNTNVMFGSRSAIEDWTVRDKNQVSANTLFGNTSGWGGQLNSAADARNLFPQNDDLSFSTNMNASGGNTLGNAIPSVRGGFAPVGELLHILTRNGGPQTLTEATIASLTAGGQLTIGQVAAVPVPTAVVLFASGLIGLVGLARRRVSGTHKEAA